MPLDTTTEPFRLLLICTGNICRSAMAHVIVSHLANERNLPVEVTSAGISSEEHGNPIDYRAQSELRAAGYAVPHHCAHKTTREELQKADLILAMTRYHAQSLRTMCRHYGITDPDIRMFRSFDPDVADSNPEAEVDDPWYGTSADFTITRETIERTAPPLLDYIESSLRR